MRTIKNKRGRKRKQRERDTFEHIEPQPPPPPPRRLRSSNNQLGLFVFLMFDEQDTSNETTVIEISRRPPVAVTDYNMGIRKHRKSNKNTLRTWRLHTWCGPIFKRTAALSFKVLWSRSPRQLAQRALKGAQLAGSHDIDVYSFHTRELVRSLLAERNG